ncbi:MAG: methyltransferase domain-containing protein [Streptosporangiales bacterium]|nr:methyltransferase domain-containing protein [Streptosporangiales bacterium]
MAGMSTFDELVAEGELVDVSTWGAGFLVGRTVEEAPPWRYRDLVAPYLAGADTLLDMGTGDGSALLDLAPLPPRTVAVEEWAPTIPAAVATLRPAGVPLVRCRGSVENTDPPPAADHPTLPFRDATFDVVANRHDCFDPADVRRVLRPGGVFVTQQVGGRHGDEVRARLGLPPGDAAPWDMSVATAQLESAGLTVVGSGEAHPRLSWTDIGAFVAYVRSVPWYVPDFSVSAYRERLRELSESGAMATGLHMFWVAARCAT